MSRSSPSITLHKLFDNFVRSRNNEKRKEKCLDELISRIDSLEDDDEGQHKCKLLCRMMIDKICSSDSIDARLEALKLADFLFVKYANFREHFIKHLHTIIARTIDPDNTIPPGRGPQNLSREFRNISLRTILKWHGMFGSYYPKLKLALGFLEQCKSIDLERLQVLTSIEQIRMNAERNHQNLITTKILELYQANYPDMENSMKIVENGSNLIFPNVLNADINKTTSIVKEINFSPEDQPTCSKNLNIELNFRTVVEKSSDNQDLLAAVNENYTILKRKFIHKLDFWLQYMKRYNIDSSNEIFAKISTFRHKIASIIEKYDELKIVDKNLSSGDESDQDFISVDERKVLEMESDDLLLNKLNDIDNSHKKSIETKTDGSESSCIRKSDVSSSFDKVRDWKDIAFEDKTIVERIKEEKGIDLTDDGKRKMIKKAVKSGTCKSRIMKKMKVKINPVMISRLKKF
uniref:Uncharacterized protein n=1 Tax=Romanomermis culicivorax TaxID=13658 RepID=A0A915KGT3_ROMCU